MILFRFLAKQSHNTTFFEKNAFHFTKYSYFCSRLSDATLAQLVEQRIRNA